jgi:hypothetical protein
LDAAIGATGMSAAPAFLPACANAAVAAEAAQMADAGPDAVRAQQLFLAALARGEVPDEDLQDLAVGSDASAAQRAACVNAALDIVASEAATLSRRRAAMGCVTNICGENFDAVPPHAARLLEVCVRVLEREADAVLCNRALLAWSNLAEVAAEHVDEDHPCFDIAGAAARGPRLLPVVLAGLRPTHEADELTNYSDLRQDGELTAHSAAQLCLARLAHPRVAPAAVMAAVSSLVEAAVVANASAGRTRGDTARTTRDWRSLEAAALALGSCVEAPQLLTEPLLRAHLPRLVALLDAPQGRLRRAASDAIAAVLSAQKEWAAEADSDDDEEPGEPPPLLDVSLVAVLVRSLIAALRSDDGDVADCAVASLGNMAAVCEYDDDDEDGSGSGGDGRTDGTRTASACCRAAVGCSATGCTAACRC